MPRENSFSDSEGRSLTPDLEDELALEVRVASPEGVSPTYPAAPQLPPPVVTRAISPTSQKRSAQSHAHTHFHADKRGVTSLRSERVTSGTANIFGNWSKLSPKEKFRAAVRKVISMHRGTTLLASGSRIGAEPGVDPRRVSADYQYGHIHTKCDIEITDYSSVRSSVNRLGNEEFISVMEDDSIQRPVWSKVRWINIGGLSWDVIKALSIRYNIHPLALEDVFHGNTQTRSKADYYSRHLFLRVLSHEIGDSDDTTLSIIPNIPRSSSPIPEDDIYEESLSEADLESGTKSKSKRKINHGLPFRKSDVGGTPSTSHRHLVHLMRQETQRRAGYVGQDLQQAVLDALKEKDKRVIVNVSPLFLFLFRDGTVISIRPENNLEFMSPISSRLRQPDTGLRQSADASLLIHAILDLTVDRALQITDAYDQTIRQFEQEILIKPKRRTIRYLHILSGDLILHKRTLDPIKTLVYGLRRYDVDRCAALVDTSNPSNANVKIVGFMSHKSKIYLADVYDHMDYILTSLDMFSSIAENLIAYSFNSASYDMNVVMRRLTLVTIIGLPLTLLTGYFGMNFDPMWSVNQNSDLLFWKIAIPTFVFITGLSLWQDIVGMFHYMYKKWWVKYAVPSTNMKIKQH